MQTYQVYCEGISPLLMHRLTDDTLEGIRTGIKEQKRKDLTREQQSAQCIYREGNLDTGSIIIPTTNLFACLAEAGREVPYGGPRSKVSTATSTKLPSFLTLIDMEIPLVLKEGDDYRSISDEGWKPDVRRGVNPNGGEMVAICRPRFDRWGIKVTFELDEKMASASTARKLFDIAGRSVGLCDFRPRCKGPFGRFRVVEWQMTTCENTQSDGRETEAESEE